MVRASLQGIDEPPLPGRFSSSPFARVQSFAHSVARMSFALLCSADRRSSFRHSCSISSSLTPISATTRPLSRESRCFAAYLSFALCLYLSRLISISLSIYLSHKNTLSHTHSLSLSLSLTRSLSLSLSLTYTRTLSLSLLYLYLCFALALTLALSHSVTTPLTAPLFL